MTNLTLGLSAVGLVSLVASMGCAGINPLVTIRKTFVPLTTRDFWFPPCSLCWAVRAVAVVLLAVVITPQL